MILLLSVASPDLVTVFPIGTSPGPHVSGTTWASPGPGPESSSPGEADMVTLVPIWMSPGPGDSGTPLGLNKFWEAGPQLGLTWTWCLLSPLSPNSELLNLLPPRPHQDLVSLVPTWVASGYGYTVH